MTHQIQTMKTETMHEKEKTTDKKLDRNETGFIAVVRIHGMV